MKTVTLTNVVDGSRRELKIDESLKVGDRFRLIGRTTVFVAVKVEAILGGTVPVVTGVSEDGRFKTSARVEDTAEVV